MKKYISFILLLLLLFSGCSEKVIIQEVIITPTPTVTAKPAESAGIFGVVAEINLDCSEPYVDIQWKNLYNQTISIEQNGKLYKRLGEHWVDIGGVYKENSFSDYVTINANAELDPIRYSLKDLGAYREGRYLIKFKTNNKYDAKKITAEAEIYVTEKTVIATPEPTKKPKPTPEITYIGTDACTAKKDTFNMYKNIKTFCSSTVKVEIIELTYCATPERNPTHVSPHYWTVRLTNYEEADIILRSAKILYGENEGTDIITENIEKRIRAGQAGDISIPDIHIGKSGKYEIYIEYTSVYSEREIASITMELPEKYSGEKFPVSLKELPTNDDPRTTGKPVIYLYPEKETDVSVKLTYDGLLKYTYPRYNEGWYVLAKPDGTLINYQDNLEYSYLFWEGYDNLECDYSKGFCVKGEDTLEFLQKTLAQIGLTPKEYNEFIVYWLPQMQDNPYNIISFQYENYCEMAQLQINPEPDSLLRVFMAYKPSETFIELEPQEFSKFERKGFTVVEWGGKRSE